MTDTDPRFQQSVKQAAAAHSSGEAVDSPEVITDLIFHTYLMEWLDGTYDEWEALYGAGDEEPENEQVFLTEEDVFKTFNESTDDDNGNVIITARIEDDSEVSLAVSRAAYEDAHQRFKKGWERYRSQFGRNSADEAEASEVDVLIDLLLGEGTGED